MMQLISDELALAGVDVAALRDGVSTPWTQCTRRDLVPWAQAVRFFERGADACGGLDSFSDAVEANMFAAFPELQLAFKLSHDAAAAVEFSNALVDAVYYQGVRLRSRRTNVRELTIEAIVPEDHQPSPAFFYGVLGSLRAATVGLGLPPATVNMRRMTTRAEYTMVFPADAPAIEPSDQLASVRARAARTLPGMQKVIEALRDAPPPDTVSSAYLTSILRRDHEHQKALLLSLGALEAVVAALRPNHVTLWGLDGAGHRVQLASLGARASRASADVPLTVMGTCVGYVEVAPKHRAARENDVLPYVALAVATAMSLLSETTSVSLPEPSDCQEQIDWIRSRFSLTSRETEVLAQLCKGLSNKEIAERLGCSRRTVEAHLASVTRKTGTSTRTELISLTYRTR